MAQDFDPPSINPANLGSMAGAVQFILTKFLQRTDDMLPAMVVAYDRSTNRARVQPLINFVTTGNKQVSRAQVASIPVLQMGGGGYLISFPINTGDLGWIKANDSDISLFLQGLSQSPPNTARLHTFEDALFIPDSMFKQVVINPEDADAVVLQSTDGSVRIALHAASVKITAPLITLDTPNVKATGNITADGDIVAKGGVGAPISLHSHLHGGVMPGSGDTGTPI